eukprot:14524899-Alexandrium_andersonii.AAC.1
MSSFAIGDLQSGSSPSRGPNKAAIRRFSAAGGASRRLHLTQHAKNGAERTPLGDVSGAAHFKLRTPEAILNSRAVEQPSHLCRDSAGPNRSHGEM